MASTVRIDYKNKSFWIPSAFIERLSEYLCKSFEDLGVDNFSDNLQNIYELCDNNRNGFNINMADFMLDEYLVSDSDKSTFINVIEQTKILLRSIGDEITVEELNQFEANKCDICLRFRWSTPIQTQSLIATLDIIIELINGTWQKSDSDIYYAGFSDPNEPDEI